MRKSILRGSLKTGLLWENPIDYIVWDYRLDKTANLEEGMIYIMDVKSAKAQLSTKQRRIRDLVKAGRVEWREIRLD